MKKGWKKEEKSKGNNNERVWSILEYFVIYTIYLTNLGWGSKKKTSARKPSTKVVSPVLPPLAYGLVILVKYWPSGHVNSYLVLLRQFFAAYPACHRLFFKLSARFFGGKIGGRSRQDYSGHNMQAQLCCFSSHVVRLSIIGSQLVLALSNRSMAAVVAGTSLDNCFLIL